VRISLFIFFISTLLLTGCKTASQSYVKDDQTYEYKVTNLDGQKVIVISENPDMVHALKDGRYVYTQVWLPWRGVNSAFEGVRARGFREGIKAGFPHKDIFAWGLSEDGKAQIIGQYGQNFRAYGFDQGDDREGMGVIMRDDKELPKYSIVKTLDISEAQNARFHAYIKDQDESPDAPNYSVIPFNANHCISNANKHFEQLQFIAKDEDLTGSRATDRRKFYLQQAPAQ
jgi:hypothetical protein